MKMKKIIGTLFGMSLLFASLGVIGAASSAQEYEEVGARRDTVASCYARDVITGSDYQAYSNDDWVITYGGGSANKAIGSGNDSKESVTLASYSKYADGENVTTTDYAVAVASLKYLENVGQITLSYQGGNDLSSTLVYTYYSEDGETFLPVVFDSASSQQGSALSKSPSSTTFTFISEYSGYFAIVFKYTGTASFWNVLDLIATFETPLVPVVTLDVTYISGVEDDTFTLVATVQDFTEEPTYSWTVEGGTSVTVEQGSLVGYENEATVTIIYGDDKDSIVRVTASNDLDETATATCLVKVYSERPASIKVTDPNGATSGTATFKDTIQLDSEVVPEGDTGSADPNVTWSSSNEEVATVDQNGLVTAIAAGTANITATSDYSVVTGPVVTGTYALTVAEEAVTYELVTANSGLVLGNTYALAYSNGTSSRALSITPGDTYRTGTNLSIADSQFSVTDGGNTVAELMLVAGTVSGTYAFYDLKNNGYLCAGPTTGNYLQIESTLSASSSFEVTVASDGTISATSQGPSTYNKLRCADNGYRFACYAETSLTYPVSLFHASNIANEGTAEKWAENFYDASTTVCSNETHEASSIQALMLMFENRKLSTPAKDILKYASQENASAAMWKALERYDFIVNKYTSCTDVLGRRAVDVLESSMGGLIDIDEGNLIYGLAFFGLIALGGTYLIVRRKKARR